MRHFFTMAMQSETSQRDSMHCQSSRIERGVLAAARTDGGGGVQVGLFAVDVAARWPYRQPVEGVVTEALGILGARQAAGSDRRARAGRGADGACPGQAVLFIVAEPLDVGPGRQGEGLAADVAHGVVARRFLKKGGAVAGTRR